MKYAVYIIIAAAAYVLGSVSSSIVLSKLMFRTDVRKQGSGNAGATNVARNFGMKAGVLTLLGDMLKTVIAMSIGVLLGGETGKAVAGIACLVGHSFPLFFGFKGGKGISVGAVVAAFIGWPHFCFVIGLFILGVALTRIVSVGSVMAAAGLPVALWLFGGSGPEWVLGVTGAVLVVWMHRQNILRLARGEEKKFQPKRSNTPKK